MDLNLRDIPGALFDEWGLCHVQWGLVQAWIRDHGEDAAANRHWCSAQRQWIEQLAARLAPPAKIVETDHLLLLMQCRADSDWVAETVERMRAEIVAPLADGLPQNTIGKLAVLVFAGEASFRQYARAFIDKLANSTSRTVGVCVSRGDVHIALAGLSSLNHKLPHELAHAILAPLGVPRWVDEGYAIWAESAVGGRPALRPGSVQRQNHRLYWKRHGLERFWSGEAFSLSNTAEMAMMADELARMLVAHVRQAYPGRFSQFVTSSRGADQGLAAARSILGTGLSDLAAELLGPGEWHHPADTTAVAEQLPRTPPAG